ERAGRAEQLDPVLGCRDRELLGVERTAAGWQLLRVCGLGDGAYEAVETRRGAEDEQPRLRRLDAVRVWDAARRAERFARGERDLPAREEQRDLAVEDVEDLVLLVVDMQRRHVALRDVGFEQRVAPFRLLARDVDVDEPVDEPERR